MWKFLFFVFLLIFPNLSFSANDDVSDRPPLGTATNSDALLGVDASATAGSRLKRILFNGNPGSFLSGDGTWITPNAGGIITETDPTFNTWLTNEYTSGTLDIAQIESMDITLDDGVAWDLRGPTGTAAVLLNPFSWADPNADLGNHAVSISTPELTANRVMSFIDAPMRIPAASSVNADGTIIFPAASPDLIGTTALGTTAVNANSCRTVTTATTGIVAGEALMWSFVTSLSGVAGYNPAAPMIYITNRQTTGNVTFDVCNPTATSITPGAVTVSWRVPR